MIPYLNAALAAVVVVLAFLWYREGHIANLSLAAQGTRIVVVAFSLLGLTTSTMPLLGDTYLPLLPWVTWGVRTFIGIILLALVVTTARARR